MGQLATQSSEFPLRAMAIHTQTTHMGGPQCSQFDQLCVRNEFLTTLDTHKEIQLPPASRLISEGADRDATDADKCGPGSLGRASRQVRVLESYMHPV